MEPLPVREAEEEPEVEEEVADEVKNEVRDEQRENEVDPPLAETNPERNLSSLIPKKMRGISIPVNKLSGLSRYMSCGARVDVLVAIDRGNGEPPPVYTAAKNALVLSSGEAEEETGEHQTAVTLAVYPEEAEALVGACYRGLFHLILCPDNECSSMD
ncbi:MAG: RcpC/CpaB family pilus assembly protein [Dethiobacteria bacterium]